MTKYGIIIYTEVVLIVKLITRKASSEARQRADRIIRDVHKLLGKEYRFFCRPIGSQTRRCIVQDKNGKYDLDYQIVLTQNSKNNNIADKKFRDDRYTPRCVLFFMTWRWYLFCSERFGVVPLVSYLWSV